MTDGGWQTIDTAPTDGTEVLAYWSNSKMHNVVYYSAAKGPYGFRWANENGYVSTPTHWQRLTAPTASVDEDQKR